LTYENIQHDHANENFDKNNDNFDLIKNLDNLQSKRVANSGTPSSGIQDCDDDLSPPNTRLMKDKNNMLGESLTSLYLLNSRKNYFKKVFFLEDC
jgi:hypothetical protein